MSVTWVTDLPADAAPAPSVSQYRYQSFYDDPRFYKDWEEGERLCADVVSIPFYPDDLPTLKPVEFGWTPAELQAAVHQAKSMLFR